MQKVSFFSSRQSLLTILLIFFLISVLFGFTFNNPAQAGSFTATISSGGIVRLSGSESFECVPEESNLGSWAIIRLNGQAIDQITSSSSVITVDAQYNFSCSDQGNYTFSAEYAGYKWMVNKYGERVCVGSSNRGQACKHANKCDISLRVWRDHHV